MNINDTSYTTNQNTDFDKLDFDKLYAEFWKKVVNDAYKRLGNLDEAQDIAQEVFTYLWKRKTSDEPIENVSAYLFISTRNAVFRHLEKENRRALVPDLLRTEQSSSEAADSIIRLKEFNNAFHILIEALPPQQQAIFKMKYEDNLNPQQIADFLNITPKTVRNQLGRAVSSLKGSLSYMPILMLLTFFR